MKTLFIIGNGFDINLGLKTRYGQFYDYYKTIDSKSKLISELKQEIENGIENWADLELAFGKHTIKLNDIAEFDEVYDDVLDNLGDYLMSEEEKFDVTKINLAKFFYDLTYPEKSLTEEDKEELNAYKLKWKSTEWRINIMTLNYTRTIEKMLSDIFLNVEIAKHHGHPVMLNGIQHIHGYTDKRTIMGVNDVSQIAKTDFHENQEILEALIKTKNNRVQRHTIDRICEHDIAEASLIVIFGSSLGDTDNYWWQLVGEQLIRGVKVIIFRKGEQIKERFGHKTVRSRREIKKYFLAKTGLNEQAIKEFEMNVYVGVNTEMFNLI